MKPPRLPYHAGNGVRCRSTVLFDDLSIALGVSIEFVFERVKALYTDSVQLVGGQRHVGCQGGAGLRPKTSRRISCGRYGRVTMVSTRPFLSQAAS